MRPSPARPDRRPNRSYGPRACGPRPCRSRPARSLRAPQSLHCAPGQSFARPCSPHAASNISSEAGPDRETPSLHLPKMPATEIRSGEARRPPWWAGKWMISKPTSPADRRKRSLQPQARVALIAYAKTADIERLRLSRAIQAAIKRKGRSISGFLQCFYRIGRKTIPLAYRIGQRIDPLPEFLFQNLAGLADLFPLPFARELAKDVMCVGVRTECHAVILHLASFVPVQEQAFLAALRARCLANFFEFCNKPRRVFHLRLNKGVQDLHAYSPGSVLLQVECRRS